MTGKLPSWYPDWDALRARPYMRPSGFIVEIIVAGLPQGRRSSPADRHRGFRAHVVHSRKEKGRGVKVAFSRTQWQVIKVILIVLAIFLFIAIPIYFNLGPAAHSATL